jgi:hypothetical protein
LLIVHDYFLRVFIFSFCIRSDKALFQSSSWLLAKFLFSALVFRFERFAEHARIFEIAVLGGLLFFPPEIWFVFQTKVMWGLEGRASTPTSSRIECPSTPRTVTCAPRPNRASVLARFTAADSVSAKSLEDLLNAPRKKQLPPQDGSQSAGEAFASTGDDEYDDDGPMPEMLPHMSTLDDDESSRSSTEWLHRQLDERTFRVARVSQSATPLTFAAPEAALVETLAAMTVNTTPVRKRFALAAPGQPVVREHHRPAIKVGMKRSISDSDDRSTSGEDLLEPRGTFVADSAPTCSSGVSGRPPSSTASSAPRPVSPLRRRTVGLIVPASSFEPDETLSPILKKRPPDRRYCEDQLVHRPVGN